MSSLPFKALNDTLMWQGKFWLGKDVNVQDGAEEMHVF